LAPRLVWTGAENIASTRIQSQDHQACSELLYLLHCPHVFHIEPVLRSSIPEITTVVNVAKFPIVRSKEMNPY